MTSEAVFIQVGALADGFAPHGNLLATASLPAGERFTFYVAGSEPQQLIIEDEQTLSWNGKRAFDYRNASKIAHDLGTAVNICTMVFGNQNTGLLQQNRRGFETGAAGLALQLAVADQNPVQ